MPPTDGPTGPTDEDLAILRQKYIESAGRNEPPVMYQPPVIKRRSLPEQLRYYADRLQMTGSGDSLSVQVDLRTLVVQVALRTLAGEIERAPYPVARYIAYDAETQGYAPVCAHCGDTLKGEGILKTVEQDPYPVRPIRPRPSHITISYTDGTTDDVPCAPGRVEQDDTRTSPLPAVGRNEDRISGHDGSRSGHPGMHLHIPPDPA
jgi:hypothetical protein